MASKVASPCNLLFFAILVICYTDSLNPLSSPLMFLKDLNGTRKGDHANGLIELKKYLGHLGYIDYTIPSNSTQRNDDFFDDTLESAIKMYQNYYNLKTTGFLDQETVLLMSTPRCGVPDRMITSNSEHIHLANMSSRYAIVRAWPRSMRNLSFSYTGDFSVLESIEISKALRKWQKVSPFRFRYSGFSNARVIIGFKRLNHGDGVPFDGPGGSLGHAFYPTVGVLHLDADENWVTLLYPGPNEVDVQSVALHELGHILGLDHSKDENAVMYAYFEYGMTKRNLNRDDINGIKALYPYG